MSDWRIESLNRRSRLDLHAVFALSSLAVATPLLWLPWKWPLLTLAALPLLPAALILTWRRPQASSKRTGLGLALCSVSLATCIASIPVGDWQAGLPKVLGMALGVTVLGCLVRIVASRAALDMALSALTLGTLAVCAVGVSGVGWNQGKQPLFSTVYSHLPGFLRGWIPATPAGTIHPNELAGVLVLVLPPLLTYAIGLSRSSSSGRRGLRNVRIVAAICASTVGLVLVFLTQSRSGLIGIGVALSLLVGVGTLQLARSRRVALGIRSAAVTAYAACMACAVGASTLLLLRWITSGSSGDTLDTFASRQELWGIALSMVQSFPFTGVGLGQFSAVLQAVYVPLLVSPYEAVPHAHNLALEYATELGLPGALAVACVVAIFFRDCFRGAEARDPLVRWSGFGLALGMVAFLIFGSVDAIAPGARAGLIVWILLGLGASVGNLASNRP